MQTGCPFTLHLIAATSGDIKRESELHRYLAKEHYRGEWFTTGPRLRKMIERAKLGLDVLTGELPRVKREWWPFDPDTPDMGTESRRWFESLDGDWDKRQRGEFAPQF